ncbi:hypothetical protein OEZ85_007860 [Tetradesmus obliquus]|uniref:Phosphoribosyltransferase domain-containing protein n=1 Tax=Tetradesmus obliquus TaxID=3088 RepID=A0ABY8TH66_TETOB|nr:hypothetical protein OEZ85_007860 [Tetradesmus obliquus]
MVSGGTSFANRQEAGEQLGAVLREQLGQQLGQQQELCVFGLVRGGLPVAEPVAAALSAPLDAFVVRKIGAPLQPEFGIGAISEGGHTIINEYAAHAVGATPQELQATTNRESQELARRIQVYRAGHDHLPVEGKTVVVVDDGLATGVTARAALQSLRAKGAGRLVLAVPVGSASTVADMAAAALADDIVCLSQPRHFRAVGQWYDDFNQTSDAEVVAILKKFAARNAAYREAAAAAVPEAAASDEAAAASSSAAARAAAGLVIFAHGSGSSRHSPRNRQVAATLNEAGFATLLFDLLSEREAEQRSNVFNIPLLASRLQLAVEWMEVTGKLPHGFPVGFFGASTGGGAALWAAAYLDARVSAVVVRGGRPDLAAAKLPAVTAPTLLLVGGNDYHVLDLNRGALQALGSAGQSELVVVPLAGHLFEAPGQLEAVAEAAAEWFGRHLKQQQQQQQQQHQDGEEEARQV